MRKFIKFYNGIKLIILNSFHFKAKIIGLQLIFLIFTQGLLKFIYLKIKNKKISNKFYNYTKKFHFSKNYFNNNSEIWIDVFKKKKFLNKDLMILEIGSFEGMSLLFFQYFLKVKKIISIDLVKNKNFMKNIKSFKNVKFFNVKSNIFFKKKNNYKFDIIYVDGSHYYKDVYNDLMNSEKKLKKNGLMIIDDLLLDINYRKYGMNFYDDVIGGVIMFLKKKKSKFDYVYVGHQLILKKLV